MEFKELKLEKRILDAIEESGYKNPTEIQEKAIPYILDKKDIQASAQTGTGKTAAFALPIINNIMNKNDNKIKVVVLSPTRELAMQTRENFRQYAIFTKVKVGLILGGMNQRPQVQMLKKGVDIIIATPGRLLDLINQKHVNLKDVQTVVLDESDTMLDMGFIKDIKKIMNFVPKNRQTLLFSATMPKEIENLAKEFLTNPVKIEIKSNRITVDKIEQQLYYVDKKNKIKLLLEILSNEDVSSVLIFTRTKNNANKLGENLIKSGVKCDIIHGNKSQKARTSALNNFKNKRSRALIATDIAARGIDISELSHVINFEMPNLAETYVHRIGRTGRAGSSGNAISLCDYSEKYFLKNIQKLLKFDIPVIEEHNYKVENQEKRSNKESNNRKNNRSNNKQNFKPNKELNNKKFSSRNKKRFSN